MRNIAVVGAGPAGLLLATGLLAKGYAVTVYSERSAEGLFNGRLAAAPCIFARSRGYERELGLNFWDDQATPIQGAHLEICGPAGERLLSFHGRLSRPAVAIDLRMKGSRWLTEFERRGGRVLVEPMTPARLAEIAPRHDLVLVASGKGSLSQLFERDAHRSPHSSPRRQLTLIFVTGLKPAPELPFPAVQFFFAGADGEFFFMPSFDRLKGPLMNILFEAVPGSRMDRFRDLTDPAALAQRAKEVVRELAPWAAPRLDEITVADETAWVSGAVTPTVRHPVGRLPSGGVVMGLGDTLILNDPIAGQGANCASKMAHFFTEQIVARGDLPFTAEWMQATFERFWEEDGRSIAEFTNMLLEPPPPHVQQVFGAASQNPAVANGFVEDFSEPKHFWPWILHPEQTPAYLQRLATR